MARPKTRQRDGLQPAGAARAFPDGPLNPLAAAAAQAESLKHLAHRTYEIPRSPWFMGQTWLELLLAHWPVGVGALSPHVPEGLAVESFDGTGWLGITPFRIGALRLRGAPPAPFASGFRELNVRTYVTRDGRPGIWFFSLDASSRLAVEAARRLYHLPYFLALIDWSRAGDEISVRSVRAEGRPASLAATYRPSGDASPAKPGTLEHFLAERYCLYAQHRGRIHRTEIHHRPWPLQPAQAELWADTMPPQGISLPEREPLLHFSERLDVVLWRAEPVS